MKKTNKIWQRALCSALACALLLGVTPAAFATDLSDLAGSPAPTVTAQPQETALPETAPAPAEPTQEPAAPETPAESEGPAATEEPAVTEQPEPVETPAPAEEPVATETPVTTEEPAVAPEVVEEMEAPALLSANSRGKQYIEYGTSDLNIYVDNLGNTHYGADVGRGRFNGFQVADWTCEWTSSNENVVSFGATTGLYATFVAVNPGTAIITHTGKGWGVTAGNTYITYYTVTVTENSYDFRLSTESSPNVTVYYAANGAGGTSLQALTPGAALPVYDRAYKQNGAHFYVSVPAGYTGTSSFAHRNGASEAALGGFGSGNYDPLDGSAAANAAKAQGASMMFEYNRFNYDSDYRFREFKITAVPVDITVKFVDGSETLQSTTHNHSNLGLGNSTVTFPAEPKKDGFSFAGWQCSSNSQVYTGPSASVDGMWVDTTETSVTYTLTALWNEEKPEYEIAGLPANGKQEQMYNGSPLSFNPALTFGGQVVGDAEFVYEQKNDDGSYTVLAGKPSVVHVDESCTVRVIAKANGKEVARSGDIQLTVTPRPIRLKGVVVKNRVYNGLPQIDSSEAGDLRTIVHAPLYVNGNEQQEDGVLAADRLALAEGVQLPACTNVWDSATTIYPVEDFEIYDRATGKKSSDYTLSAEGGKVSVKLEILPRALEVTVENAYKTYGEADPTLFVFNAQEAQEVSDGVYTNGLLPDETLTLAKDMTLTREPGEEVGTYAFVGSPACFKVEKTNDGSIETTGNYAITLAEEGFVIDPRPVMVYIQNASKTVGQADPAFTAKAGSEAGEGYGLLNGHTLTVLPGSLVREAGETVGEYAIDLANPEKMNESFEILAGDQVVTDNYTFEVASGVLTIGAAPAPVPTPGPGTDPTPAPTTAPVVVPPVPAGPAVIVLPPAEEEIPDDDTPLVEAPEATPEPTPAPAAEEDIGDDDVPLAGGPGGSAWALLNLILALVTVLGSALLFITWATGKKRGEEVSKRHGIMRLVSLVPAIGAVIAFILTENMSLPMVFADKWTLLMALIALVQLAVMFLARKDWQDKNEGDGQGMAPANA